MRNWLRLIFLACILKSIASRADDIPLPVVHDSRLSISLFATDPEIVTPIGLAIDDQNRIYVIESHTHLQAKDYKGPKGDRVKVFQDKDGDGKAEKPSIFAEDIQKAMNLAFSPDGELFVVCAKEVWHLHDKNRDGVSETRTRILELDTTETYPHNSLLGITFSHDGWLYVSRGNTGGRPYTFRGQDQSTVSGYGDGGNIIRCRPDGTQIEFVATGFWNPFDIKFDYAGRLICVDNDPDSRCPNKLAHIVPRGDYGYRSLYGGSGLHPYQAWDGDLPGTLPMMAGVGEAPSGVLDCTKADLPADYNQNLLVTVWGEHTIARYKTVPFGISLRATNQVLISGTQRFRPVGIETDQKGAIYITDWVEKDYPNHGKGRIWRVTTNNDGDRLKPRAPFAKPELEAGTKRFQEIHSFSSLKDYPKLQTALTSSDHFLRHGAVVALTKDVFRKQVIADTENQNPSVRLGTLLTLRLANDIPISVVKRLLSDPHPDVRRMALICVGEQSLTSLQTDIHNAVSIDPVPPALFETYLATIENLSPQVLEAYKRQVRGHEIKRALDPKVIGSIVENENFPSSLRALALAKLRNSGDENHFKAVASLARHSDASLALEAVRTLGQLNHAGVANELTGIALDRTKPINARSEAIAALSYQTSLEALAKLSILLKEDNEEILIEALRVLRPVAQKDHVHKEIQTAYDRAMKIRASTALLEQFEFILRGSDNNSTSQVRATKRPASHEEWRQSLFAVNGNSEAGRRVFYSRASSCTQCHQVNGRGGIIGPDLTTIARSASRQQLIESILNPSSEIAPQFQGWNVETKDGESHFGLQAHLGSGGSIKLIGLTGEWIRFTGEQVAGYSATTQSLMPEGLEETMTVSEFRDLIAFLESLR